MSNSQRHRADSNAQTENCIATTTYLTSRERAAFEEAKRQALNSDGSGEERRKKVVQILADCDRAYRVGFLSGLIRATIRENWPVQERQRVADDTVRKLSYVLSLDQNQHSLGD